MAAEYRYRRRVEFAETDMAGIVHFSNFFRYMEQAEHAFLRSLGLSVHFRLDGEQYGWPRVHVECDFRQPLRFEDEMEVHLRVREKKERSLTYDFVFNKIVGETRTECATGSATVVCVAVDHQAGILRSVTIPEPFSRQIERAN